MFMHIPYRYVQFHCEVGTSPLPLVSYSYHMWNTGDGNGHYHIQYIFLDLQLLSSNQRRSWRDLINSNHGILFDLPFDRKLFQPTGFHTQHIQSSHYEKSYLRTLQRWSWSLRCIWSKPKFKLQKLRKIRIKLVSGLKDHLNVGLHACATCENCPRTIRNL